MDRRKFIAAVPAAGIGYGAGTSLFSGCSDPVSPVGLFKNQSGMNKVVLAMLSMQRATWEQGVAMQALLELGEKELVILMARDAVLRQSDDGRLAMLGEEHALTDAASPG